MNHITILLLYICCILSSCTQKNEIIIGTVELSNSKLLLTQEADSLDVPWDLQYDKTNNYIIFSEIKGNIKKLDLSDNSVKLIATIPNVFQQRTTGLLGMALYQPHQNEHYLFVSYTTKTNEKIYSNLCRYIYKDGTITNPNLLLQIPGNTGHNGSRIIIGTDKKIYWATGDAAIDANAQDISKQNGKILRINIDGSIPNDNPIPNSYVYAWGFRNMQGLAQGENSLIYTSEHGDAVEDEVNLIQPLHNYGWPLIEGKNTPKKETDSMKAITFTTPLQSWTPVIAPAGIAYYGSTKIAEWRKSLILSTLKSQSLRILKLSEDGKAIIDEYTLFKDELGRLRSVLTLPNGDIYFCSSNRDWNPQKGFPKPEDDRIYKLSLTEKTVGRVFHPVKTTLTPVVEVSGKNLYEAYCASCHKADGKGITGTFPSLAKSTAVNGDQQTLSQIILNGLKDKTIAGVKYEASMPAFNFLKDEEATAIINYIRTNFGNQSSTITINQFKQTK
ncbi:PQQ-dependent sugar dehydrogenase [Pedobacter xixiisoli]|uniref:Glucose/arabinose dehydrogenase, beta-propeller fold n=1 Tax=Pedobacter xixiisoli TaxID=1476464 RepID=A0A285ZYV0_9SPHI|nr:PQQ-dependent sugar dehydrogenase [Pedobacter xixiisoli]SOD14821.1 Glucose/arabinose dehydrogenase, beta-propeller fold [Pedobacter xixiisoli]